MPKHYSLAELESAAEALRMGAVLAYPTEAVFGLGCDPHNPAAFKRILALKQRPANQGMLLIAGDFAYVARYIDMARVPPRVLAKVRASWPGPFTWVFPRSAEVPEWVAGVHEGIALRVTAHGPAAALCQAFGGALVSTSANPHGQPPARELSTLMAYFGQALDGMVEAPLGTASRPSTIRDALTGAIIRS